MNKYILLLLLYAFISCVTVQNERNANIEDLEILKMTTNANTFNKCQKLNEKFNTPAPIKSGQMLFDKLNIKFIYEGIFKDGIKTVWQSLNKNYEAEKEGIIVGTKEFNNNIDLSYITDINNDTWIYYRALKKNSHLYTAGIEYINKKNEIKRIFINLNDNYSVDKIWLFPEQNKIPNTNTYQKGIANILLKISVNNNNKISILYVRYQIAPITNKIIKLAEIADNNNKIKNIEFIYSELNKQYIAIILHSEENMLSNKIKKTMYKISKYTIFDKKTIVDMYKTENIINNLIVFISSNKELVTAWIEDNKIDNQIKWFSQKADITILNNKINALNLKYSPFNLKIFELNGKTYVYWWGEINNLYIYINMNISEKQEKNKIKTNAYFSDLNIGYPISAQIITEHKQKILLSYADKDYREEIIANNEIRLCIADLQE